jgi:hypothetical protein
MLTFLEKPNFYLVTVAAIFSRVVVKVFRKVLQGIIFLKFTQGERLVSREMWMCGG